MFEQLAVIGCGMMGGSFALAMKRAGLVKRVVGYSKSPSTTQKALQMGVIDVEAPSALLAVSGADVVMFAVPVAAMEDSFKAVKHLVKPDMLLIDVGSTKRSVVDAARRVLRDHIGSFVPCHPIAGKERSGVEFADPDLFMGKQVIVTPIERTLTAHLRKAQDMWTLLGCTTTVMSPEAHDGAYAAVSHLPHLIAFAYMHSIASHPDAEAYLSLAGPGFRDFTRIAASDPEMWRDVMLSNRHELIEQIRRFRKTLDALWQLIDAENGDALEGAMAEASQARLEWKMKGR